MKSEKRTVYLDNAATTFPKPGAVTNAIVRCMRESGGNPGRGSHRMALRAAEIIYACREEAANFFGADGAERVVFTMNTTYALNIAVKSVLRAGDHVLTGNMEHNSVLRPVAALAEHGKITYTSFNMRGTTEEILGNIRKAVRTNTRALVCAHIPNTSNIELPIAEIGAFCRKRGILFIVDGAQSAGHVPINVRDMSLDMLCVPGHKGLYGPQGTGMIIAGSDALLSGSTLMEGGSGIHSLDRRMPDVLPERYEAGTLPTPAIAGLLEGIRFVKRIGITEIHDTEAELWHQAYDRLSEMPSVRLYEKNPGGVILFNVDGLSAADVSALLDREGICVRSGYHCAPMAHRALGTIKTGAVRASFSVFNTKRDVQTFTDAVRKIIHERKKELLHS